jgi:hypothetical protein
MGRFGAMGANDRASVLGVSSKKPNGLIVSIRSASVQAKWLSARERKHPRRRREFITISSSVCFQCMRDNQVSGAPK